MNDTNWHPMDEADTSKCLLGRNSNGDVSVITWGKAPHVPIDVWLGGSCCCGDCIDEFKPVEWALIPD